MDQCDVLVIGGGPAGSTVSSLLSEKGWKVVLLEKDNHPRFHIGESLLPMSLPIFDRLGVRDKVEKIGMIKEVQSLFPSTITAHQLPIILKVRGIKTIHTHFKFVVLSSITFS